MDLQSLPTLCQELIDEWKPITTYLTSHVPQQQGQGVRTRVSCIICPIIDEIRNPHIWYGEMVKLMQ